MSPAQATDNFPGTTITGNSGSVTASNTAATGQTGEPATFGGGSLNSIWYSWTAPGNGTLTLQTCGGSSNFDTTINVSTGTAVNALAAITGNDDSCGLQSLVTLAVTSGTTYRIQVDGYASITGTFTLSWSFVGTNNADLSLSKTVSNAAPTSGSTVDYTLTVASAAASTQTATGITVTDILPAGTTYVSKVSGDGTYDPTTGIWTLANSIAPGGSLSIVLRVTVTATAGANITNGAEIRTSSQPDPDSTVNSGSTTEDDDAFVSLTVAGTRTAGTPPTLVCPVGTAVHDWDSVTWTAGTTSNSFPIANIGTVNWNITNQGTWLSNATYGGQSPAEQTVVTGGFAGGQSSLFQLTDMNNISDVAVTTISLPTAVPGAQFRVFDIDFNTGQFSDRIQVTGSFNGSAVTPVLTNGISNFVIANTAYGDATSADTSANGNITVTFSSPVDTIVITYGNHSTAPANPGQQAIALDDITFCRPVANLSASKLSTVLSDPISASNPKAIPDAIIQYCITVQNSGSGTATAVAASDNLPANVTMDQSSMRTGTSCGTAAQVEDIDNSGPDETDLFGMAFAPGGANGTGIVTGTANSLAPSGSMALVFNVILD